jgi:hypothetical protein
LDRIDNNIAHTFENVKLACKACNSIKSNGNEEVAKLKIQMRKYAIKNNLPMTITEEKIYHVLRDGVTGGLANVGHRFNYAGVTKINKYHIQDGKVSSVDMPWIMTHICGCDFSSLYPSVCSSTPHPFIPYTGHMMWMPGYHLDYLDDENSTEEARRAIIFNQDRFECEDNERITKLPWFVALVKGHIDEHFLNDYINFPPIIKRLEMKTTKENLGN